MLLHTQWPFEIAGGRTQLFLSSLATDLEECQVTVVVVVGGTDLDVAGGMVVVLDADVDQIDIPSVITSSLMHVNNANVGL